MTVLMLHKNTLFMQQQTHRLSRAAKQRGSLKRQRTLHRRHNGGVAFPGLQSPNMGVYTQILGYLVPYNSSSF